VLAVKKVVEESEKLKKVIETRCRKSYGAGSSW